jgi:thiamine pyrophosphokinase
VIDGAAKVTDRGVRRRALVVADGDVPTAAALERAWPGWSEAEFVVAADGGAQRCEALGLTPDLVVGDHDSLDEHALERLVSRGVPIERFATAKDESDTELGVRAALARGYRVVTVVGALGGKRFDHALANVGLLALPELHGGGELIDDRTRVTLLTGPGGDGLPARRALPGRIGDYISLLPVLGEAVGVTTEGLRFPLRDEPLPSGPARGLSNVRVSADAAVTVRHGRLLIVETMAILTP